MAVKKKAKKKHTKSEQGTRGKVVAMKKTGKKKPAGKGQSPKKRSASKSARKKVTVKAVSKRRIVRSTGLFEAEGRLPQRTHSQRRKQRARPGSQEICRACPMSKAPIPRVLTS